MSDNNTENQGIVTDLREVAIIKAQRNYLLEMYDISMKDIEIYDKIKERIVKRWRKLKEKPQSEWSIIDKYEERVIALEAQNYEVTLGRVRNKINEYNEGLTHKIMAYNIQLGYEVHDLSIDIEYDFEDDTDYDVTSSESGTEEGEISNDEITPTRDTTDNTCSINNILNK